MAKRKRQTAMHHSEPTLAQKFLSPHFIRIGSPSMYRARTTFCNAKEQLERSKQIADDLGMTLIANH